MIIEEAIDRIENHIQVHKIGEYSRFKLKVALDMAITALRAQRESNDPLTLEELRALAGEPVWVKCLEPGMGHLSCWGIRSSDCVDGYHTNYCDMDYGKGWLAYRRKPSE